MMLSDENRQKVMFHSEGAVLASAGSAGSALACDIARCQIDGLANALIRIEGREETAHFVFALSDRVTGGMRDTTTYLSPLLLDEFGLNEEDDIDPPPPPRSRLERLLDWILVPQFAWGVFCGLALLTLATIAGQGRP